MIKNKSHGGEEDQLHKHKIKQPKEEGETGRKKKSRTQKEIMMGEKMKKQILKKSKMKVNQAEGELVFYVFILVLQFTAIR